MRPVRRQPTMEAKAVLKKCKNRRPLSNPSSPPLTTPLSLDSHWQEILKIAGNKACCDCGSAEPKWASINLGITLCIACSGVHRSLGVHYSKVRSLTLDVWEPEVLRVLFELGNDTVNQIYEGSVSEECGVERASENCERSRREAWIRAKYIERRFVLPLLFSGSSIASNREVPDKWSVQKTRRRSGTR